MSESCPCGSGKPYDACCGPLHAGTARAETAEALMRSRYSAYAKGVHPYLKATLSASRRKNFNAVHLAEWSRDVVWTGLTVFCVENGGPSDKEGWVEFEARFEKDGVLGKITEASRFRKKGGRWCYESGRRDIVGAKTRSRADERKKSPQPAPKVGRNAPCPCGSGKKYKRCCGS